jgi:hypothetical protein
MIEPHTPSSNYIGQVTLGPYYTNQVYFDLPSNQFVKINNIEDWDLGFTCDESRWEIYINTSRNMKVARTGSTDFASVTSSDGLDFIYDKSDGNPDSTAIGTWFTPQGDSIVSNNEVYVVDLGQNSNFNPIGFVKISLKAVPNGYQVKVAKLDGTNPQSFVVLKSATHNLQFLSLSNGVIDIEPEKDAWTLHFTRYTTYVYTDLGVAEDYQVVGTLLNRNKCSAALDTTFAFADITLADTVHFDFSSALDRIGYEWKYYDFDNSIYTIVPDQNFIIKDHKGLFYKLRFIDFYSPTGDKGTPQFEFVQL